MSTRCSDHLIRLEGTVHSAFKASTSLKKHHWSYWSRKCWSRSEGDCANSRFFPWEGRESANFWSPLQGMHFLCIQVQKPCFSHRIVRRAEEVGKKLVFAHDSHTMIHSVPYYRQRPWPILCDHTAFLDFRGTQLFVLSYSRMAWFLPQKSQHKRALTEGLAEVSTPSTVQCKLFQ